MKACPTAEELGWLLEERMGEVATEQLIDHLGECERCRDALSRLSTDDQAEWASWEAMLQTSNVSWRAASPEASAAPSKDHWPEIPGYELLSVLGAGGMGIVYKARHAALGRLVALKVMREPSTVGAGYQDHFQREAETLARLHHPNMVQIYDILQQEGCPVLVLELVDGQSLADTLRERTLQPAAAAGMVETLARAMQSAHLGGIVHRDLKPANLLLPGVRAEADAGTVAEMGRAAVEPTVADRPGQPQGPSAASDGNFDKIKITDFGLARIVEVAGNTKTGQLMGTPSYMAPEQARGAEGWSTPAVDIYALGAVLYESLTGRPPHRAESPYATLMQIVNEEPVPPSRIAPSLPTDLETITLKCLAKNPGDRYGDCLELAEDLRRFQNNEPILARAAPTWVHVSKWAWRHPVVSTLSLATLAAVIALIGVWGRFTHDLQQLNRTAEHQKKLADVTKRQALQDLFEMGHVVRRMGEMTRDPALRQPELAPVRKKFLNVSLDSYEGLLERFRRDARLAQEIADGYYWMGILSYESGDLDRSLRHLRSALSVLEHSEGPPEPIRRVLRATYLSDYGMLLVLANRLSEAEAAYDRVFQISNALLNEELDDELRARAFHLLANARFQLGGTLHDKSSRQDEALQHLLAARTAMERQADVHPPLPVAHRKAAMIERLIGEMYSERGEKELAEQALMRSVKYWETAVKEEPGYEPAKTRLAQTKTRLALLRQSRGHEGLTDLLNKWKSSADGATGSSVGSDSNDSER